MRKLALFTTFVVAASSGSAMAWPTPWYQDDPEVYYDRDHDEGYRNQYDRDAYRDSRYRRDFRGRWVPLATGYSAVTNSQQIVLHGRGGPMRRLRVQAERGAPVITRVTVEFIDNQPPQVTNLNTRLPQGRGEVIPLNGNRGVKRIIVYTEPRYGGRYSVFGA